MERNLRKTRVGLVTSDKMDKTIVVSVTDNVKHPLYKKIVLQIRLILNSVVIIITERKILRKSPVIHYWN